MPEPSSVGARINHIRQLMMGGQHRRATSVALSVAHDTVGAKHPIARELEAVLPSNEYRQGDARRALLDLYDLGALSNQRLAIAGELEGELLDVAQQQVSAGEEEKDHGRATIHRAIAAFIAGAALEDALRRLCDANGITYDPAQASIQKLQSALYRPSQGIEVISVSESKQITAWGDTRNHAGHGYFEKIMQADVLTMVIGVRAFIEKHLK